MSKKKKTTKVKVKGVTIQAPKELEIFVKRIDDHLFTLYTVPPGVIELKDFHLLRGDELKLKIPLEIKGTHL